MTQRYSTREAARAIGMPWITLQRWVGDNRIKAPKLTTVGGVKVRLWSAADVARIKKQLPKLYQRKRRD